MKAKDAMRAASILDDLERLEKHLLTLDKKSLMAGYYDEYDNAHERTYTYPLDSQGERELKVFLEGQLNRHISEIKAELDALGVEPTP